MERSAALGTTSSSAFMKWEEVYVLNDKGRREVRYFLKRRDGTSDLAVVGKEMSLGHMWYHYAIRDKSLLSMSPFSCFLKLRSRREVIRWLSSIVADMCLPPSPQPVDGSVEGGDACKLDLETFKDVQSRKMGQYSTEFLWVGSAWTCRKKRKHYESFRRNGVRISVHDFVYILAEEDKRLVAYLDDMYEDSRGNKMVVVRWFHKVDEVGIALPHSYNDREIFFSLCLQDLSIECIDGLAVVLGPQHYENFLNEAAHTKLEPFLCHSQFYDDDIKPFDITQVKGYWNQEILRYISISSPSKACLKSQSCNDSMRTGNNHNDAASVRPRKRLRLSKDTDMYECPVNKRDSNDTCSDVQVPSNIVSSPKGGVRMCSLKEGNLNSGAVMQKHQQNLTIGSESEVLSQDSGIRGCWFRALIIKKCKDKVKVRYQDIKDAADESINLEEWILASRVAAPDQLGFRLCGRTTIRPAPFSSKFSYSWINVGSVVDAWWHDGWWEGIVVQKESEDRIHVYFPGEKRQSIFGCSDLRHSEEWLGNGWKEMKERPELLGSILSDLRMDPGITKSCDLKSKQAAIRADKEHSIVHKESLSGKSVVRSSGFRELEVVQDPPKDDLLAHLKWNWSSKRRPGRKSSQKVHCSVNKKKNNLEVLETRTCESFFIPSSLKVDHDNCKFIRDSSLFGSPVVSPLTSLVMSR